MVNADILKDVVIFKDLADHELDNVAQLAYEKIYESDYRIFAEGAWAANMYVVVEGEVNIRISPDGESKSLTIDTMREGDIFGWSALSEPYSLTAEAVAAKKSKLLVFRGDGLRDLFEKNNHIGYLVMKGIAAVISSRFRHARKKLTELLHNEKKLSKKP